MYLKNLFFIGMIGIFSGFSFAKTDKSNLPLHEKKIISHSKFSNSDSKQVFYFECDDFVSDALTKYTIELINRKFLNKLNCTKEFVHNIHDSKVIDTIFTFSNPDNVIQIYRTKQVELIFSFDVTDPVFELSGNVKPGMTKEDFSRKFLIKDPFKDKVQIINSEGNMGFLFYFEGNRLKRINSYLYID